MTIIALMTCNDETQSHVFLMNDIKYEHVIFNIVNQLTLNDEQKLVIHIIIDHITERSKVDAQLLMRIFEEREIEKSRLIKVIRAWFVALSRSLQLIIIATTGIAAFNVKGHTLHNAVGIPVDNADKTRVITMSDKKAKE